MSKEKKKMGDLISRSFEYNVFQEEKDENIGIVTGLPIVFEQPTDIGGQFQETIARGAVSESVLRDVGFFFNHDLDGIRMAGTRNGTLQLMISDRGVEMKATLNLRRNDCNDVYWAIKDRNIDNMSFMFRVEEEEWSDLDTDYPKRRITKIGYVQEVSATNWGAYLGTEIYARANNSLDSDLKALDNARAAALDNAEETNEKSSLEEVTTEDTEVTNDEPTSTDVETVDSVTAEEAEKRKQELELRKRKFKFKNNLVKEEK